MQRNEDREWESMRTLWQEAPRGGAAVPAALRARVRRDARRIRIYATLEWLLAAVAIVGGIAWFFTAGEPRDALHAALLVTLSALALGMSVALRRGLQQPLDESVQAYLAISKARLRAGGRILRAAWILFAIEFALFAGLELAGRAGWLGFVFVGDLALLATVFGVFALTMVLWTAWYVRTLRLRAEALQRIERELAADR